MQHLPVQLLGLVVAQGALRDAGYGPGGREFDRDRASVILGVTGTLELAISLGLLAVVIAKFSATFADHVGKQILQQGGGQVEARRYTMRGQLNREAWYDADCVLVRWDLPITGGGWINVRREMP